MQFGNSSSQLKTIRGKECVLGITPHFEMKSSNFCFCPGRSVKELHIPKILQTVGKLGPLLNQGNIDVLMNLMTRLLLNSS